MKIFILDQNFDEKKELIEQLKNLINQDTSINEKYNQFKKIQNFKTSFLRRFFLFYIKLWIYLK